MSERQLPKIISIFSLSVLLAALIPISASADEWSLENGKEFPPEQPENRIIKWCSEDGKKTRYASANLKIKGFKPCGRVSTSKTCDAGGNRLIGKGKDLPRDHKDCSVERIFIVNYGEDDTVDRTNMVKPDEDVKPLSEDELAALQREVKNAKKKHKSPQAQMQSIMNAFSRSMSQNNRNKSKQRRRQSKRERERMLKSIEEMLKGYDPSIQKAVKELMDPRYWQRYGL